MAVGATAAWRVMPSGSNTNGGGYDCGLASGGTITAAATGSNGSWATSAGTTTFTDTTAAAFTSGMAGASIRIEGVGQFSVLSYVSSTQITITAPKPATSNFGSNASWAVGPGQDYSQQNSAQQTWTNLSCTGSASTTLTDSSSGGLFTSAMVGNAIQISGGSGYTAGVYFVVTVTDSNDVVLDRTPASSASAASGGTGKLGGGWADFWTNTTTAKAWIVAGNVVYILGGSSPSYASPDYTASAALTVSGSQTAGRVKFIGDPNTPSGNGYSGYPLIKAPDGQWNNTSVTLIQNLFLVRTSAGLSGVFRSSEDGVAINIILDQDGWDGGLCGSGAVRCVNCEVFSSISKRSTNANAAIALSALAFADSCNVHDCIGVGITVAAGSHVRSCIAAKNGGDGIYVNGNTSNSVTSIVGNTIDGNAGNGLEFEFQIGAATTQCFNNIISNNTSDGIKATAGTLVPNDLCLGFVDYNTYYNNGTHYSGIAPGPHDTVLSSSPYVASSTENYALA